jgi:hypothetical protein
MTRIGFSPPQRGTGRCKDNMGWSGWDEFGNLTPNEKNERT